MNSTTSIEKALAVLSHTRKTPHGWQARCPAHDDRRPSLSIRETGDGTVLLHCFSGCSADDVCHALGLQLRDLFRPSCTSVVRPIPRATPAEIRIALRAEAETYRRDNDLDGTLLTTERNEIRHRVAARLGVHLKKLSPPLHEGAYAGRERDPAWPTLFARALRIASIEIVGEPLEPGSARIPVTVLMRAEEIAAKSMRDLERVARPPRTER